MYLFPHHLIHPPLTLIFKSTSNHTNITLYLLLGVGGEGSFTHKDKVSFDLHLPTFML